MPTLFSSTDFRNELIRAAYNAKINNLAQLLPISANRKNALANNLTKHYEKIMSPAGVNNFKLKNNIKKT